ncbi:hypothetical protein NQ186_13970 [Pseudomonas zeae]|nr:hypothetical protein [Pseudomonas sp. ok266]UUT15231.1 hypothetical protein NQ186_13970 [Pseudomonas zeae]
MEESFVTPVSTHLWCHGVSDPYEQGYDRWFRANVQAALDDLRPGIPHEEAMVRLDQLVRRETQESPHCRLN